MKYLLKFLWLFIPREGEGDGDGGDNKAGEGGDGGSGEGAQGGDGEGGQQKPAGGIDPEGRPDWLADKFWNPDTKAPRTEVLGKAYNELEGKLRSSSEALREEIRAEMRGAAPDKYVVELAEDLKIPDGVELSFSEDDPLVSWFFGFAKEHGMSQETVNNAINEYVSIELGNMPDVQAEISKLGDHGQDRMLRVHNWLESKLSDKQLTSLNSLLGSAEQVEALEVLMKSSGPSDFEADSGGDPLTLEELREMQNDRRYWQEKNKGFIKKVEDGYARLYKGVQKVV